MQSSKKPGTGDGPSKRPSSSTATEKSIPRGLAKTSNGTGAGLSKGANGNSRGESDSYYNGSPAHPLASTSYTATNGGSHSAPMCSTTGTGAEGISGMYKPPFQPTYSSQGASYGTGAGVSAAIPIPNPTASASHYHPVPVPQANPFYPSAATALAGPTSLVAMGGFDTDPHPTTTGEAASYYGNPQTGTSAGSSFGSTAATNQQNYSGPGDYPGPGESITSSLAAVATAIQAHQNHSHSNNHHSNPPPPLRQSFRKLWENLRAEEHYEVGQFELYCEITGVCTKCFTPGTTYTQAPRTHHYGQRWSKTKGWRVAKKKTSRRVWMRVFRRNNGSSFTSSSSSSSSSSSDSTSSVSDSDLSDTTRKRRVLEKRIRRERKELRRQERREQREQSCYSSGHRRTSNSSSIGGATSSVLNITGSTAGVLRGGDLDKSKDQANFYNPGYGPDGKAHPTYYSESIPQVTNGQSSGSVLGGWFRSSSTTQKKSTRRGSRTSITSSNASLSGQLFEVSSSASASDDGLAYGRYSSSPSSLGSRRKMGWLMKSIGGGTKGKGRVKKGGRKGKRTSSGSSSSGSNPRSPSPHSSDDGLAYGSRRGTDTASIRSRMSYTESVANSVKSVSSRVSSVFGVGKLKRRKSLDDYGTPSHDHNTGSTMVGPGIKRYNSTGGSRTWGSKAKTVTSATATTSGAAIGSSSWGGRARRSDKQTAASTKGGWFSGGPRIGGWFGGSKTTRTSRSGSVSSQSDTSWQEGLEVEEPRESYTFSIGSGGKKSSVDISSTIVGTKSHSTTDISSTFVGTKSHSTTDVSSTFVGSKSHSTTDVTKSILKGKGEGVYTQRPGPESQVFTTLPSGERVSTKEVWIEDGRRERSPDRPQNYRPRRTSSVDSLESHDSQSRSEYQKSSITQKTTSTTKTGILGRWFSGGSESILDQNSKGSKQKSKQYEELKRIDKKPTVFIGKDGGVTKEESRSSSTSDIAKTKLTKVYPMATTDPLRFDTTASSSETYITRRQFEGSSFVRESYKSEQQYNEQERKSSKTVTTTAVAAPTAAREGAKVTTEGFLPLGSVEQQRRPLPAPVQTVLPTQPVQPSISTSTTTIINNHNTIHHTISSVNNNSSTSISNTEKIVSQPNTVGYNSASAQDIVASAAASAAVASAAAAEVSRVYAEERAEREERERREIISREKRDESEKERSERIQRELTELRVREEKAALLHKEKSEREEKERRALRIQIEQKEKEELELKLKHEREERAAIELKKKTEWEAREREKDEAALLARQKQDKERFEQVKTDEERKYREWCRQESLRRQQREREAEEHYQVARVKEEEKARYLREQETIQKEAERIKAIETEKRIEIERELQLSKDEEKRKEQARVEVSMKLEEVAKKNQKLEEERRAYVKASSQQQESFSTRLASQQQEGFVAGMEFQQKKDAYTHTASSGQKSSIEGQRMEFQKEQDHLAQKANTVEATSRSQIVSIQREQQIVETQRVEISQERHRIVEKLSELQQIAFDAHRLGDETKVREVQQQIQVEKQKESRLRIEEEKKTTAVVELKGQADARVRELEMQVADEKKRDLAAQIEGQRIVAAETESKRWQHDEKVQQLDEQILIGKNKEVKLKIEEEKRVLDQMEQTRVKDTKARQYIAQVQIEEERSMQAYVEQKKMVQVEAEIRRKKEESQSLTKQVVTEEKGNGLRRIDQEYGQVGSRNGEGMRIDAGQAILVTEEHRQEALRNEEITNEATFEEEKNMTDEQRIIRAEVQRRWEAERKEAERISLEKEVRELERQIEEQKVAKRARRRAREADPGYKGREARRSRERSKARENEAEKARREEVEYIRKNAGLDKVEKKKETKKKRYSTFDPLPAGDIPGFTERSWSVPNGVPMLIETPATPPPGTPRFPQRLHCEGSYFPRMPTDTDPSIPTIPAIPAVYVASPDIAETSTEFEKRTKRASSESVSKKEAARSLTSEFEAAAEVARRVEAITESSRKIERSITSSEFEKKSEGNSAGDARRIEPARAVTSSEFEHSSGITGTESSIKTAQSGASVEETKAATGSSRWGSFGSGFGSRLTKAVTQAINEAPSLVTGKPYDGTPVAPVPTVPNIGAAVIDYQQKGDSQQYAQTISQQQQESQRTQEFIYQGPQLPPSFSFQKPIGTPSMFYGPELPQGFVGQSSSVVHHNSASLDSQSQLSYERTSSDSSRQQTTKPTFSEVVYGPPLAPTYVFQQSYQASVDSRSQSSRTTSSDIVYGPELPPVLTPQNTFYKQGTSVLSGLRSEQSYQHVGSENSRDQEFSQIQASQQGAYDSTKQFRIPGGFDEEEEVAPEVVLPISRDNQTSSVPIYRPTLSNERRSVSESARGSFSQSASRVASTLSQEVRFDEKEISRENQTSSVPIYRSAIAGENRPVFESSGDVYSTELVSRSDSRISKETGIDISEISRENKTSSVPSYRPNVTGGNRSMSESATGIYSAESASRLASTQFTGVDLEKVSRENQTSSVPIHRRVLDDKARSFSESATSIYSAESGARSTSLSRDQDFQTPPTGSTYESSPIQSVPIYRQPSSPPNVFAFKDEEASSAVTPTASAGRAVTDDGKRLTREQIDKNNEFMAIATASAEQAGFNPDLILGLNHKRLSIVLEAGETTPTGRRPSIASPRPAFVEEIEDEDSPKIKRQLGQSEFLAEAYLSHAETLAREEAARSRFEQYYSSNSSMSTVQSNERSTQPARPNPAYSSTPKALEWKPAHIPLPQPTPLQPNPAYSSTPKASEWKPAHIPLPQPTPLHPNPAYSSTPKASEWKPAHVPLPQPTPPQAISAPKEVPLAQSAPPFDAIVSERKNRTHGITRTAPASRSASASGSFRTMDSVREDDDSRRPSSSMRSTSVSGGFRSVMGSSKQGSFVAGDTGSLHGSTPSFVDSGVGLGDNDSVRRAPRSEEEEAELRRVKRQREREEFEKGSRGRRGGSAEPGLQRRSTEQWSAEKQSIPRRSTEQWTTDRQSQEAQQHLQRRSTDSVVTSHEPQPIERHSRRSIDSVRRNLEGGIDINEVEGIAREEADSPQKGKSKMQKVTNIGKMFSGWGGKSKGEKSGSRSREASQTRADSVKPLHKRSVSEVGVRDRPADLTRRDTEEWEQVTPPQKSRAQSLRDIDMSDDHSSPITFHDEPENYSFDTSLPQHVEANVPKSTPPETVPSPESERPKSERKSSIKSGKSGLSGIFKAARQFKRAAQSPSRIATEEKSADIRPVHELSRADTDRKGSRPSSSAGVSLHQDVREEQQHVENTWGRSSRGDAEEQRVAEDVPLPTSAVEEPSLSRLPLSRSMSLKQKSSKSLRRESETGESQSGSGNWSQVAESTEGYEGYEEEGQKGLDSNSRLPVKSKSIDRKSNSTSAIMLTLSEGVDLSSDVKRPQEDKESLSEPPDIFDDRGSPPSYENLPQESSNSPMYSPNQQNRIPDTFSFVSRTPSPFSSPILKSAVVDIYEEYPALPQSDSSSPYISPKPQNTTSEQIPIDEEIPSLNLNDLSTCVQAPAPEDAQPQWQAETQSPFVFFQAAPTHNFPVGVVSGPPVPEFPKVALTDHSISSKNVSASPIIEDQPLSSIHLNDASTYAVSEVIEDLPPLPQTEKSTPTVQALGSPIITASIPDFYPTLTQESPITEVASPTVDVQMVTSVSLSESRFAQDGLTENTSAAEDTYTSSLTNEDQESTQEVFLGVDYSSSPNLQEKSSEGLLLSPIETQGDEINQQFDEEITQVGNEPGEPLDPMPDVLENLPVLPESPFEEFKQQVQESPFTLDTPSSFPLLAPSESEDQSYVQVQQEASLSGRSSPRLPVLEYSQYVPLDESSSPHTLQVNNEVAQSQTPQPNTDFSYTDADNLPELPPSGSSPVFVSPILDELPPVLSDLASTVPSESSVSQIQSELGPPITVLEDCVDTLPPSGPTSPRSQPEIVINEPVIEDILLISQPSPQELPKVPHSSLESAKNISTSVELPMLPLSDLVSTYPAFEESVRSVDRDSRSPSIVAEDESSTVKSTSPNLADVPEDLPQLSEPSSLYDLPEELYIPDIPDREYTYLSPIEEMSESAVSRSASVVPEGRSSVAMPMSYPESPDIPAIAPHHLSMLPRVASPVLELPLEGSFEPRQPDAATLAEMESPAMVDRVLENPPQGPSTLELPSDQPFGTQQDMVKTEVDIIPSAIENDIPKDLPEMAQGELPIDNLEVKVEQLPQIPSFTAEPEFVPIEYGIQHEIQLAGLAYEKASPREVKVQPDTSGFSAELPLTNEDILAEAASVLLPEDKGITEQSSSELALEYKIPAETDPEPTSQHSQLAQFLEVAEDDSELRNLPLPEDPQVLVYEELTMVGPTEAKDHSPEDLEYTSPAETEQESTNYHDSLDVPQLSPIMEAAEESEPENLSASGEADLEVSRNDLSLENVISEHTFPIGTGQEPISRRASEDGVQLLPILDFPEEPMETKSQSLLDEIPIPLPSIPVAATEVIETKQEPSKDQPEYKIPEESEVGLVARRFSVEDSQPALPLVDNENPALELNMMSYEDIPTPSPVVFAESEALYMEDTNEIPPPTKIPDISIEPAIGPTVEAKQVQEEYTTRQPIYDVPPVEGTIPNTEVEFSKNVEISELAIENGTDIEEEDITKNENQNEKEQMEIKDIALREKIAQPFQIEADSRETFFPQEQASGGTIPQLDAERAILVPVISVEEEEEVHTEEQGIKLELSAYIGEESVSNTGSNLGNATEAVILGTVPEEYGTIVEPSSTTHMQSTNQFNFDTIGVDSNNQFNLAEVNEGEREEEVALHTLIIAKSESIGGQFTQNEEEGDVLEGAVQGSDDKKVLAQQGSIAAFTTPALEQAEESQSEVEPSASTKHTSITGGGSDTAGTEILGLESQNYVQNEEEQTRSEEEKITELLSVTESILLKDERLVRGEIEQKDTQGTGSEYQESFHPEYLEFESLVDSSDSPSSNMVLPEITTEPLDPGSQQDTEDTNYAHPGEGFSQPEHPTTVSSLPDIKQKIVATKAPPPLQLELLPVDVESSIIHPEFQEGVSFEEVTREDGENSSRKQPTFPEPAENSGRRSPQDELEALKTLTIEPELHNLLNTTSRPTTPLENHQQEQNNALQVLLGETSPFTESNSSTTRKSRSLPFSAPEFEGEHSEGAIEVLQSTIHLEDDTRQQPSIDTDKSFITSLKHEKLIYKSRPSTPQTEILKGDSSTTTSPNVKNDATLRGNEGEEQVQESPLYISRGIPKSSEEEGSIDDDGTNEILSTINGNQEDTQQVSLPQSNSEVSYQIPGSLMDHATVDKATELSHSVTLPQELTVKKSGFSEEGKVPESELVPMQHTPSVTEGKESGHESISIQTSLSVPGHESVPMQPTLSEGSRRKSKKARQREKKRKSLQGTEVSSSPIASAEIVQTPSAAEHQSSGISVQNRSATDEVAVPVVSLENNVEAKLTEGAKNGGHVKVVESMSKDSVKDNKLSEAGPQEVQNKFSNHREHVVVDAKTTELERSSQEGGEFTTLPIVDSLSPRITSEITESAERPTTIDQLLPIYQSTTTSLPPATTTTTVSDLEDLPQLPPSQPNSRPSTPKIVVDLPNESTTLQSPESPQGEFIGNEYSAGVSLQPGSETSLGSPILTSTDGTSVSHLIDGPEDKEPNPSSFGDGAIQAVPIAQVGLGSSIFPSQSMPQNLLGTMSSPAQRFASQLGEIDESTPGTPMSEETNQHGVSLSMEGSPQAEDIEKKDGEKKEDGEKREDIEKKEDDEEKEYGEEKENGEKREGEEGEEGIEHRGDHGSYDSTVITVIKNETAQPNDKKKNFAIQVPFSNSKIPVFSEEAAPVSKERTTNTCYTVNAEDPPFQSSNNKSNPTAELFPLFSPAFNTPNLPIDNIPITFLPKGEALSQNSSTKTPRLALSLGQTPPLNRKPTEPLPISQGVPLQLPFIPETPSTPSVFLEDLSQTHDELPTTTQPKTENILIPSSEASITPPPPLTHSSSFESAIEFWKRRISIPSTTDLIASPELSPFATHSESGVSLSTCTLLKSRKISTQPLTGQASEPLNLEDKGSLSDSDTTTESSVKAATASQPHFELGINQSSFSSQDREPPITDPSYQISLRQVLDERELQKDSIEISLQKLGHLSRRESINTQDSCDSLRTISTKADRESSAIISKARDRDSIPSEDLPGASKEHELSKDIIPETEESETSKGEKLSRTPNSSSDPFVNKQDIPNNNKQPSQLAEKTLDLPFSYSAKQSAEDSDNLGSLVKPTHPLEKNLPTITEQKAEDTVKENVTQSAPINERRFISTDDLLARLPVPPVRKLNPIPDQPNAFQKIKALPDEKMDILKRGERRRTVSPSLRRAGSQLESPNASSEHIIFGGERYQTVDNQVKTLRKTDLYEAWGDKAGEPKSPTRPPSIRRRQSMQIVDLENRLEGLAAENTNLTHEKANIEKTLSESIQRHKNDSAIFTRELENGKALLTEKDSEITELKKKLSYYREEVTRLSQANDSLTATNTSLSASYKFSYGALASKYKRKQEQLVSLSKDHSELQSSFSEMQTTMENVIRNQLQEKDFELDRLRDELAKAREEVRKLQQQATTRQDNKYLDTKDLQHFSGSCQQLYGSLKIWCNQFSSFSTGKKCVHVSRLKDEAVRDRVEDVMLDDRGVRRMLKDEKRRSEVFMAITMRMIWEHVFTRYLFGLEVEERQKLLTLEKTLAEVGEHEAVHQWRATTLTLLSMKAAIETKRVADTEEIVHTILNLLNFVLPPPPQYNSLAMESLRNIVRHAVQLAVEMRTQRAEYVMKRPPLPEYDDSGEVTNSVPFIASSMQNRGMDPVSDKELESEGATVKLVLFPQVIRRGNEYGEDYGTEVTVLPMQVLINRPQLRSESRASNKSVSSIWRDQQQHGGVSRLTPITDHSPGETPRTTPEKAKVTASNMLPIIPEQTIRLVPEDSTARPYPTSPSAEKRRRLDDQ